VLLVGLGAGKSYGQKVWRRACASAISALARTRIASAALALERPPARELGDYEFGRATAQIAGSTLYRINDLKTGKKPPAPRLDRLVVGPVRTEAAAKRGLEHGAATALAMSVQRDLANLPANVCTPSYLAERARAIAREYGSVRVQVLDEPAIKRLKPAASRSSRPPRWTR
jgi:leucyl aminopeptidase